MSFPLSTLAVLILVVTVYFLEHWSHSLFFWAFSVTGSYSDHSFLFCLPTVQVPVLETSLQILHIHKYYLFFVVEVKVCGYNYYKYVRWALTSMPLLSASLHKRFVVLVFNFGIWCKSCGAWFTSENIPRWYGNQCKPPSSDITVHVTIKWNQRKGWGVRVQI